MFDSQNNRRQHLTRLEQLIMDYVWAHPGCTAELCREGVASQRVLKDSTIRTILRNLEEKGYVNHKIEGRAFVFQPAETPRNVAVQAAQQLIDRFCGGSVEDFLVGLVDNQVVGAKQLRRLTEQIEARKAKTREKKA
jgi:BlaI family transcriptional regulator, penicillinase repressor